MRLFKCATLSVVMSLFILNTSFADSVMIDPGHGGNDSGAISYDNTIEEKDLNLDTAKAIIEELEKHNVDVYTTRTEDVYVSLEDRSRMANEIEDLDLFVSIHHNASENKNVNRGEVIYSVKEKESQKLAECIGNKMARIGDMEIKIYNRYNARGTDYYSVLRHTNAISVIVEISFITSEEGLALVDTPEERRQNGILVAQGIMDYFGIDYEGADTIDKGETLVKESNTKKKSGLELINNILNKEAEFSKSNTFIKNLLSKLNKC